MLKYEIYHSIEMVATVYIRLKIMFAQGRTVLLHYRGSEFCCLRDEVLGALAEPDETNIRYHYIGVGSSFCKSTGKYVVVHTKCNHYNKKEAVCTYIKLCLM